MTHDRDSSAASMGGPLPTAGGEAEVASSMPATGNAARVYVVMGHDEERGWAVAAYTDKEQAEACSEAYQAEADSELEFYRVKELTLNV